MTAAIIIVFTLLVLFSCILGLRKSSKAEAADNSLFNRKQNEIDVEVLQLLLSREEDEYLRGSLPGHQFRQFKRERIRLAWKYLKQINKTTRHLIPVMEASRSSIDAEVSQAARELLQIAFRIRLNVPIVQVTLLTEWLCPMLRWPRQLKIGRYRELVERVVFILQRLEAGHAGTCHS